MSSYATSKTVNQDQRNFAEEGAAVAGQGSAIAYPTSVSVFGSPESQVGDITFVSHAPAPAPAPAPEAAPAPAPGAMVGLSDQLASIMSNISGPAAPAIPTEKPAAKPNYILWAVLAVSAFLIWRM